MWIQDFIRQLKANTPCADCKKRHPYYVQEFDHIASRGKKSFNISDISRKTINIKLLFAELAKCEIVCSNCHKIRTYKRAKARVV